MAPTLWAISDLHTGTPATSRSPSRCIPRRRTTGSSSPATSPSAPTTSAGRSTCCGGAFPPSSGCPETTNSGPPAGPGAGVRPGPLRLPGRDVRRDGDRHPEHPYPVWTGSGGPATIVPMFLLYDYTFLPEGRRRRPRAWRSPSPAVSWPLTSSCCPRAVRHQGGLVP